MSDCVIPCHTQTTISTVSIVKEIVEMQLNYLTLADKDQLSTLSRFSNSSRSM